jgi:hypothetical protein
MAAKLHLAKDALALHLLLQDLKGLVDIVVAYENLHSVFLFDRAIARPDAKALGPLAYGYARFPRRWRLGYASILYFRLLTDTAGCHFRNKDDLARSLF